MSRGPSGPVRPLLQRLARQARVVAVAAASAVLVALPLAAVLAAVGLDALAPLPAGLRLALLAGLTGLAAMLARGWWRERRPLPPEALARRAEQLGDVRDNCIINACQFEAMGLRPRELAWVPPTSAAAAAALERCAASDLLRLPRLWRALALLAAALAALAAGRALWPDRLAHGLARLALPLADLPPLGAAVIAVAPSPRIELDDGGTLAIRVRVRPTDGARRELPPPLLLWDDGREAPALRPADGAWTIDLPDQRRSSAFRIACAGSLTPLVQVAVLPPPGLTRSRFTVDGPEYAGIRGRERPGPPAALAVLPGARATLAVAADRPLSAVVWEVPGARVALTRDGDGWTGTAAITVAGPYALSADGRVLARGEVRLEADAPPEVELGGAERNRYVDPGTTLALPLAARDDHGLAEVAVLVREAVDGAAPATVQQLRLLGPPGPGELAETVRLALDPARFAPGRSYLCEAVARDRRPQEARSPPLVLRVRAVKDLALPPGDPRARAFEALRRTLAEQIRARAAAGNLLANLAEIRAHKSLPAQAKAAGEAQEAARALCVVAVAAFAEAREESVLPLLRPIADPAMPRLRDDLAALAEATAAARLPALTAAQDDLVARLTALLGSIAAQARAERTAAAGKPADAHEADRRKAEDLKQDLERFLDDQQRILERSRTLADGGGADLTADEERIAGELAKAEREWAKFLEEKLTNFAQNPPQDFSDASLASETNAVWQDVKLAADALDGKKVELAVPREQAGIENAQTLVNNLEKWLADTPDKLKWEMEDAQAPADVAVTELPAELEDIVGDLLDKAEEMTPDIQDATSSWMDSLDKGAGWTAADGPISNMSAKGITGNQLPNQSEIGGRSGEGRSGRSSGQMVQDEAVGKGGQETPTRLSQTPFEQGSVKDSSKETGGGATGGGKLSGFDQEGLRGPAPPAMQQAMQRLTGKQQELRQQAEAVAVQLRSRRLPSAAVENAALTLEAAQAAARRFDPGQLRQAHTRLLDDLAAARRDVASASTVQQERSRLGDRARSAAVQGADEPVPPGYEQMAGAYFRALAGEGP